MGGLTVALTNLCNVLAGVYSLVGIVVVGIYKTIRR